MKTHFRAIVVAIVIILATQAAIAQPGKAACAPAVPPVLYGTLGACNNANQGGACTHLSTLVQLDPWTGALLKVIGPIGFTVNGLAWDQTTKRLYATTPPGDVTFHGLITIDPKTGIGTPVNASVVNFGLDVTPGTLGSPVHSITIDSRGNMVGWYDEFAPPDGVTDTFVRINKKTGKAVEFPDTGIDSSQNGVSFSDFDLLWNIDSPKFNVADGTITQTAYLLNPLNGKPLLTRDLTPPTAAALGDFNPVSNLYYGLNFIPGPAHETQIVLVDLTSGEITTLSQNVSDLHTIAFVREKGKK